MKRINEYLFGQTEISLLDAAWFYGGTAAMILFTVAMCAVAYT